MAKKNIHAKNGYNIDDPQDAIHMGEGKRIRLEDIPEESSAGDLQVGNRRYNDLRYILQSDGTGGNAAKVTNYELIITSDTTGIASVNWIDNDLESNSVVDQAVTFIGLPSAGNFRIDLLQAHDDGTVSIKPGTEDDILGVLPPAPDAEAIGVTTILWNDAGEAQQPGNQNPNNDDFPQNRFATAAAPNTTGKYAKIWEGKLSNSNNYGIIIDYQDTINAVDFQGSGSGRVQLSFTANNSRDIIASTVQFETVNSKSIDGEFVLVQIAGKKAALFHKASHYWSRIQFRVTFHNTAVKKADFVNNGVYGALPGGTSYSSEAFNTGDGHTHANQAALDAVEGVNTGDQDLSGKVDKVPGKSLIDDTEIVRLAGINDRFKGKYTSLAALESAVPTANAGDYAQVDTGGSNPVSNYNWDVEDGWVIGSTGGTVISNTDELPEGSTNLYFTATRVLNTIITGVSFVTNRAILATDSILVALGLLQKQITDAIASIAGKQDTLVPGTNIKTIDGNSILGSGDLVVSPDDFTPQAGTVLAFDGPNKYGFNGTPLTGNLTFSSTGAKETVMIKARHNAGTEPSVTPPGGVTAIFEGGEYVVSVDNILYAICHKNDAGTVTHISYNWTQNQS